MADKYRLEKGTTINNTFHRAGTVIELDEEKRESEQVQNFLDRDLLVLVEEDTEEGIEEESTGEEIEYSTTEGRLEDYDLQEVKGIGPAMEESLLEQFDRPEEILEMNLEDVDDKIVGMDEDLIGRLKSYLKMV